jgi:transposase-like protein
MTLQSSADIGQTYTEEFKIVAVKQLDGRWSSLGEVARRLGVKTKSLYRWQVKYDQSATAYHEKKTEYDELRGVKSESKRVT